MFYDINTQPYRIQAELRTCLKAEKCGAFNAHIVEPSELRITELPAQDAVSPTVFSVHGVLPPITKCPLFSHQRASLPSADHLLARLHGFNYQLPLQHACDMHITNLSHIPPNLAYLHTAELLISFGRRMDEVGYKT